MYLDEMTVLVSVVVLVFTGVILENGTRYYFQNRNKKQFKEGSK